MDRLMQAFTGQEPLFLLAMGIIAAECVAWYLMPRWYITQGIPVFRQEISFRPPAQALDEWLLNTQPKSFWVRFHFKVLDAGLVGFRESLDWRHFWHPNYTPLMRAVLSFDRVSGKATLTGYLNYSFLYLVPLLILLSLQRALRPLDAISAVLVISGITVGLYTIQLLRYEKLLATLGEQGRTANKI